MCAATREGQWLGQRHTQRLAASCQSVHACHPSSGYVCMYMRARTSPTSTSLLGSDLGSGVASWPEVIVAAVACKPEGLSVVLSAAAATDLGARRRLARGLPEVVTAAGCLRFSGAVGGGGGLAGSVSRPSPFSFVRASG